MTIKTFNINSDKSAFVKAYLPDAIAGLPFCEKRPSVLIFPGGGYEYCSDREGEPIALQYLAMGYAAFVVTYACNERFPEPLMNAAYGRPHAIAWNIGTMGMIASIERRPMTSAWFMAMPCSTFERCEYTTPFGLPVVPDV